MTTNKKTGKKSGKLTGHDQVVEYIDNLEHPFKKEIEEVRNIILNTNSNITEQIKWNAPSFCFNNEDIVTFNLHGKGFFRLVFHCGAKVKDNKGKGPLFDDTTGLLDWVSDDRAIVKFTDMNDVKSKEEKLKDVITKWIEVTSSQNK